MQFGFTPGWAKKQYYMINARAEGAETSTTLHRGDGHPRQANVPQGDSVATRLVVADAFIEGPEREKLSKPYVIYPRDEASVRLAGIWDEWCDPSSGERLRSCGPDHRLQPLTQAIGHHRAPVIDPDREREWLDPKRPSASQPCSTPGTPNDSTPTPSRPPSDPRRNAPTCWNRWGGQVAGFTHEIHSTLEVFGMGESQSRSRPLEASDTSGVATPARRPPDEVTKERCSTDQVLALLHPCI